MTRRISAPAGSPPTMATVTGLIAGCGSTGQARPAPHEPWLADTLISAVLAEPHHRRIRRSQPTASLERRDLVAAPITPGRRDAHPSDRGVRIAPVDAKTMRTRYVRRSVVCG